MSHSVNSVSSPTRVVSSAGSSSPNSAMVPLLESSYSSMEASTASNTSSLYARAFEFSYISTDTTAEAISQCDKFILTPYANALKIIGWLPYRSTFSGYLWQVILVTIWSLCIVATMVTQILSCFKRDAFVPGKTIHETTMTPQTISEMHALDPGNPFALTLDPAGGNGTDLPPFTLAPSIRIITCEEHIISSLLLLDIVVVATYFFGVYLFVRGESEYLFGLASHVFIKNAEAQSSSKQLIGTIGAFFLFGLVWLLFSLIVRIMTAVSVELFADDVIIMWPGNLMFSGALKISLLVISLFGFFTFDMVYVFAIMNYVVQGEMNIYLIWDVRRLIAVRKYDHIDGAIKDTQKCQQYLEVLNGKTATLTGLALFVLGNLAMTTIIDLDNVDQVKLLIADPYKVLAAVASSLNAVWWCSLVALPFVQAARVTYWCEQLKDLGPEIRGRVSAAYADADLLDLESLLSFLQHINMRASIFGVPIYPWLVYLLLVAFCFTMLVLFQTDVYSIAKYI